MLPLAAIILAFAGYFAILIISAPEGFEDPERGFVFGPEPRKDALRREGEGDCIGFTQITHGGSDTAEMEQRNG